MKTKLFPAWVGSAAVIILSLTLLCSRAFAQTAAGGITVNITEPVTGETFADPSSIQIIAVVTGDTNSAVAYVSFLSDGVLLGSVSNSIVVDPPSPVNSKTYLFTWNSPGAGEHLLRAAAVETNGNVVYSGFVGIMVTRAGVPIVRIISPPNFATFRAPVNIPLVAYAHAELAALSTARHVTNVEFFADGTNDLGSAMRIPFAPIVPVLPAALPGTNYFRLIWSNAPVGSFQIDAVATDDAGMSNTSATIELTVLPEIVPPTNIPPIVSIVASDPIAIATTNCWAWPGLPETPITPPTWSNWVAPAAALTWYTNCGPKDAAFTITRFGPTNNVLSVNYSIGGTASNGVNYMTLPGSVTIPAGACQAMISIIPIDTASNKINSVILTLDASTNIPLSYVPAPWQHSAEALILDGFLPPVFPLASLPAPGSFHLSQAGPDGAWFRLDYTLDAINWIPVCTNQAINGVIDFIQPAATNNCGFYRVVPLPNGPSD